MGRQPIHCKSKVAKKIDLWLRLVFSLNRGCNEG